MCNHAILPPCEGALAVWPAPCYRTRVYADNQGAPRITASRVRTPCHFVRRATAGFGPRGSDRLLQLHSCHGLILGCANAAARGRTHHRGCGRDTAPTPSVHH